MITRMQIFNYIRIFFHIKLWKSKTKVSSFSFSLIWFIHFNQNLYRVIIHSIRILFVQIHSNDIAVPTHAFTKVIKFEISKGISWILLKSLESTITSIFVPWNIRNRPIHHGTFFRKDKHVNSKTGKDYHDHVQERSSG